MTLLFMLMQDMLSSTLQILSKSKLLKSGPVVVLGADFINQVIIGPATNEYIINIISYN